MYVPVHIQSLMCVPLGQSQGFGRARFLSGGSLFIQVVSKMEFLVEISVFSLAVI